MKIHLDRESLKILGIYSDCGKSIEVDILKSEKNHAAGFEVLFFRYQGRAYKTSCDTRYENGYYSGAEGIQWNE